MENGRAHLGGHLPEHHHIVLVFGDQLLLLPPALRTLVLTLILVPLMVFVLLPALQKLFARWLYR